MQLLGSAGSNAKHKLILLESDFSRTWRSMGLSQISRHVSTMHPFGGYGGKTLSAATQRREPGVPTRALNHAAGSGAARLYFETAPAPLSA